MPENNPYASPSSNLSGQDSYGERNEGVTQGVVRELSGTKGWTRFFGVIAIIIALCVLLFAFAAQTSFDRVMQAWHLPFPPSEAYTIVIVVAVFFAALAFLYGYFLNGFSSAVNKLERTGTESDLALALNRQRLYWVFSGIISVLFLLFTAYNVISRL